MHTKTKCMLFGRMSSGNGQPSQQKPDAKTTFVKERRFLYDLVLDGVAIVQYSGILILLDA